MSTPTSRDAVRLEALAACAADDRIARIQALLTDEVPVRARALVDELAVQAFLAGREAQLYANLEAAKAGAARATAVADQARVLEADAAQLADQARSLLAQQGALLIRAGLVVAREAELELRMLLMEIVAERRAGFLG